MYSFSAGETPSFSCSGLLLTTVGRRAALYLPVTSLLFEWFHVRRGLAGGLLWACTGLGGAVLPFILSGIHGALGYRNSMITVGLLYALVCALGMIPIKRRVPLSRFESEGMNQGDRRRPRLDWSFLRAKSTGAGCTVVLLTGMSIFIPTLWIPSKHLDMAIYPTTDVSVAFALDLKVTRPMGTGLIAIMNGIPALSSKSSRADLYSLFRSRPDRFRIHDRSSSSSHGHTYNVPWSGHFMPPSLGIRDQRLASRALLHAMGCYWLKFHWVLVEDDRRDRGSVQS